MDRARQGLGGPPVACLDPAGPAPSSARVARGRGRTRLHQAEHGARRVPARRPAGTFAPASHWASCAISSLARGNQLLHHLHLGFRARGVGVTLRSSGSGVGGGPSASEGRLQLSGFLEGEAWQEWGTPGTPRPAALPPRRAHLQGRRHWGGDRRVRGPRASAFCFLAFLLASDGDSATGTWSAASGALFTFVSPAPPPGSRASQREEGKKGEAGQGPWGGGHEPCTPSP